MRARLLLILLLASPVSDAATPSSVATLRDALERAWERTPQAQALQARQAEIEARRQALGVPWSGPPAATVSYRSDVITGNDGAAEWEAELGVPVWLPGERAVRAKALAAERDAQIADVVSQRLALAEQVRESVWAAQLARSATTLAQQRVRAAEQLEQDVARRLKAGEVARSDYNLARSELLTARTEETDARIQLAQAMQAYAGLTGTHELPAAYEEDVRGGGPLDDHPLLAAQRQLIAVAQAQLKQVTQVRRDSPEISVNTRWDRARFEEPYVNVIGVKLLVPFATAGRNQPAIASANAALAEAQAEYARTRSRLQLEIEQAQRELQSSESVLEILRQKQALTADNLRLAQKAYTLGEFDMVSLLLVRAAAFQADQELARQQIDVARARARLNQARGVLP
jgi:outer membrane protein TolC